MEKTGSYKIIPDPIKGIFFFSNNAERIFYEIENHSLGENDFSIIMNIYKGNSWIFTSHEWLDDQDFKLAISKTDEWSLGEFRMLKLGEYEKNHAYLQGEKTLIINKNANKIWSK